jgi:hypothetical protein
LKLFTGRNKLIKTVLVAILMMMGTLVYADNGAKIEWRCAETGKNSMSCQVRNSGTAPGELCTEVVKVCSDGEHSYSSMCTGRLNAGDEDTKVIPYFVPKVRIFTKCYGTEFRNKVTS